MIISSSSELSALCDRLAAADFLAVDTEFMRERSYWPKLCLLQIASAEGAWLIDPLSPGIDLAPLDDLLTRQPVLKVFHAGRQDLEIFYHRTGLVPAPIADTQVMAMVCGFGDQPSYDTLASRLAGASIDKSHRFTDWAHRPLSEAQLRYALADVVHLRPVYEKLRAQVDQRGRADWLAEELAVLRDPATYDLNPALAWQRLKLREDQPRKLVVARALAIWREHLAQQHDVPRGRVMKDEVLLELAQHAPRSSAELLRLRGLPPGFAQGKHADIVLGLIQQALAEPLPAPVRSPTLNAPPATVELLKVLLRLRCDQQGVAAKMVASMADLEELAANDAAPVPALQGWRFDLFGRDAQALKAGRAAIALVKGRATLIPVPLPDAAAVADAPPVAPTAY